MEQRRSSDWLNGEREKFEEIFGKPHPVGDLANIAYEGQIQGWVARAKSGAQSQWRPISEAPASNGQRILTWDGRSMEIGWSQNNGARWLCQSGLTFQPTHFMPLPALPTEEV